MLAPKTEPAAAELAEKMVCRGKCQYEDGLLDSAQKTLEKAVQTDPWNQKAWYYLHRIKESIYERERKERYRQDLLQWWQSHRDVS